MSSAAPPGPDGRRGHGVPTLGEVTIAPLPPGLRVRTRPVDDPGGLLDLFPDAHPLCWVRDGEGLVGLGRGRPVHRHRARAVRGGGPLVAVVRGGAGRARRRRRRGQRARRVHEFHLRRQLAGLGRRRPARGRRAGRGPGVDHGVRRGRRARGAAGAPGPAQRAPAVGRRSAAGRGLPGGGRRGRGPHAVGRAGQGGARARPAGRRRGPAGPALPARRARAALPVVLVVRGRRAGRRDARAARAAQRRDGLVAGAGGYGVVGGGPVGLGRPGGPGGARPAAAVVGEGPPRARARRRVARGGLASAVRRAGRARARPG